MARSIEWLIIGIYPDVCLSKGSPVPYMIVSEVEAQASSRLMLHLMASRR